MYFLHKGCVKGFRGSGTNNECFSIRLKKMKSVTVRSHSEIIYKRMEKLNSRGNIVLGRIRPKMCEWGERRSLILLTRKDTSP
jgi:hypothetical protein